MVNVLTTWIESIPGSLDMVICFLKMSSVRSKKDFPDKSDNYEFIFKHKNLFLKHIREKAEKKLKDNHCKFISK